MHVLIFELLMTGHHPSYLKHFATSFLELGNHVTVTVFESHSNHPIICQLKNQFPDLLEIMRVDDRYYEVHYPIPLGDFGFDLMHHKLFKKIFSDINKVKKVNYVFFPYVDYCLYAIGLLGSPFGSTPWGGVCVQIRLNYVDSTIIAPRPKFHRIKHALFLRSLKSNALVKLFTIDELLAKQINRKSSFFASRLSYLPDPGELIGCHTYESARLKMKILPDNIVILVYGAISDRKGLNVLVSALNHSSVSVKYQLLIVGKQQASIYPLMSSVEMVALRQRISVDIIDSYIDQASEQMVFAAADIVWLGYQSHFTMSGVLVLAAISNCLVVGTHEGLIGWNLRQKKLGLDIDTSDVQIVRAALIRLANHDIIKKCKVERIRIFEDSTWINAKEMVLQSLKFAGIK